MKRKPTLQDIGRKLGVSTTTVSLALRDHPRISSETKARVLKAIKDLNYQPDRVARALAVGHSSLIGAIVPNSSDPYYTEVFKGIEDAGRVAGFHVLLSNGSYDMDSYAAHVKELMSLRVGGIIAAPPFTQEKPKLPSFWQELQSSRFPFVLINRYLRPALFHQVSADYLSGVRMIIEVLASLKHRRVGYISGHPAVLPIRQRLAAFLRHARANGFDRDPELVETGQLTSHGGYEACRRLWLNTSSPPTAIVTFSDTVGVGVLRFLHEQQIRVPEDVSVLSFDGTSVSEFTNPKLSTVVTPMYDVGKKAFELVSGAMDETYSSPQDILLPVRLALRESVASAKVQAKAAR